MDIKGLLTKSYAGIPGWLIAAGGGVAIWWFFLRGGSSGSSSSSGVSADSAYGLGYAQGLQAAQANGSAANTSGAADQQAPGQGRHPPGRLPPISPGAPFPGGTITGAGGVGGFSSKGSRSSQWAGNYFHPTVTRRVVYSHYVRSAGGPAAHSAEVSRVASSAGVSEGRLKALNPVYTGKIRVS